MLRVAFFANLDELAVVGIGFVVLLIFFQVSRAMANPMDILGNLAALQGEARDEAFPKKRFCWRGFWPYQLREARGIRF